MTVQTRLPIFLFPLSSDLFLASLHVSKNTSEGNVDVIKGIGIHRIIDKKPVIMH